MASVFKRGRWVDENGRKCPKGTPGAKWVESRYYTVKVFVDGKPKLVKGYTDRQASEQLGAKLERAKAQGEQGLIDPYKAHRKRALAEHLADYIADLRALGRDDKYVSNIEYRLAKLRELCDWKALGDITADSFCRWRETPIEQSAALPYADDGRIGAATLNQYLEAARAFCNWCVKRKRMAANPLAVVEKLDETADVRRQRRALSEDELLDLLAVVDEQHQLAYRIILATGLRRDELAQLRWGDVRLNAPSPFIQLRAATTKSKRADTLPIRADLADLLRTARGDASDGEAVCVVPTMAEHRAYLATAKIPWQDEQGRRADLHALRHTFGTLLSKSGVNPRMAMSLMRHTDIALTMRVYTDPRLFDLAGAVESLPALSRGPAEAQAAQATGTDGAIPADAGRTESVTSPSAGIGYCSAGNGGDDTASGSSQTLENGGNRHKKAPSGRDGAKVPAVGFEPTTYALGKRRSIQLS